MSADRELLLTTLARESCQPVDPGAAALTEAIRERHGSVVAAVILYGSCLRRSDPTAAADPVYDFYVLVDGYRRTYRNSLLAVANWLLPPNVFYLEVPDREHRLRAKYAVVSRERFRRLVSSRTFHSYFWARFAQPVRIVFARDAEVRSDVVEALADAVVTFVTRVCGLLGRQWAVDQLWTRGFLESYRAELRSERGERAVLIYDFDRRRYDTISVPALRSAGHDVSEPRDGQVVMNGGTRMQMWAKPTWALRRVLGKLLSILRLAKGVFTFEGGLDYILWKIERHSGVRATPTAWQRRHPLLAAPGLAWRLYRLGAFR